MLKSSGTRWRPTAFTLTEMVVVVAIVVVLMAVVLPTVRRTWDERKAAETETKVRGTLASVRMRALNDKERGLLFVLDDQGGQVIYEIEADPYDPTDTAGDVAAGLNEQSTANRFVVVSSRPMSLPRPYRVAPLGVLDDTKWDNDELAKEGYQADPQDTLERHRNFFTMIFSPDGQLRVGRDVLIHDADAQSSGQVGADLGDRTGLAVDDDVTNWYDGATQQTLGVGLNDMVIDSGGWAINFVSVDGLLVYDDAAFRELVTPVDKRGFITRTAQPLYVARLSGQVIRGPISENK